MKILLTGSNGLVGKAFLQLKEDGKTEHEFIPCMHSEIDLTNQLETNNFVRETQPDAVIHAAARVGGIGRNLNSPAQQYTDNILMNTNVIHSAYMNGVKKLVAFGSVCSFPEHASFIQERILHEGEPYPAHRSYAYAKRMVDIQIEAYNSQYYTNYFSVIPGNIFGEHDNFNLKDGHVIPSLIHKCLLARQENVPMSVWGNGRSGREFVYAGDVARAVMDLLEIEHPPQKVIISGDEVFTIRDMVNYICNSFGYDNVKYENDGLDGQYLRKTDKEVFNSNLPNFSFTNIEEAIGNTVEWFLDNYPNVRM